MNFKRPRDPNTRATNWKLRDLDPKDNFKCFVGRGECDNPATEVQSDGFGGECFVCAEHAKEMAALDVLMQEMTPNQIQAFENAIKKAESK
jgi:hypothetical protein